MTIYAVYQIEDGRLVSSANDPAKVASADILAARGYGVAQRPDSEINGVWNPAALAFGPAPSPLATITTYAFVLRFTAAEYAAVKASADANVQHLMFALATAQVVDLTDPVVQQGVGYLASVGLLTADRATAILSP